MNESTDAWSMSQEQIGSKLAEMSQQFSAGVNPTAIPQTAEQVAAEQATAQQRRDAETVLDTLIKAGLSPELSEAGNEVKDYIEGRRSITPQLRAAVDSKIESWMRDIEFQKKLFAADPEANRLLTIASAMRIAPVKEAT